MKSGSWTHATLGTGRLLAILASATYYIRHYGFYERHTEYRADPIAIACIFGLKTTEEIEDAFRGGLHRILINHFMEEKG